jgi:hypothetical protein
MKTASCWHSFLSLLLDASSLQYALASDKSLVASCERHARSSKLYPQARHPASMHSRQRHTVINCNDDYSQNRVVKNLHGDLTMAADVRVQDAVQDAAVAEYLARKDDVSAQLRQHGM